jgi:hypothetical protein
MPEMSETTEADLHFPPPDPDRPDLTAEPPPSYDDPIEVIVVVDIVDAVAH